MDRTIHITPEAVKINAPFQASLLENTLHLKCDDFRYMGKRSMLNNMQEAMEYKVPTGTALNTNSIIISHL